MRLVRELNNDGTDSGKVPLDGEECPLHLPNVKVIPTFSIGGTQLNTDLVMDLTSRTYEVKSPPGCVVMSIARSSRPRRNFIMILLPSSVIPDPDFDAWKKYAVNPKFPY